MTIINLTQNMTALIDDEDAVLIAGYKWCAVKHYGSFYAVTRPGNRKNRKTIYMHRLIVKASLDLQVDHINLNKLDNRRSNLRLCTSAQNKMNRSVQNNNKLGVKGVCWIERRKLFKAQIGHGGKHIFIGYFKTVDSAKRAYDSYSLALHKEYSRS